MRRKFEYFMDMSIKDLHEELITMVQGDLWDGMVSKGLQTEIDAANKAWDEKMKSLDESQKTEQGIEAVEFDSFIEKQMNKIKDKTKDALIHSHIEKMWGGLEMASVEYFMKTGIVNGSFRGRLFDLIEAANRYKMEL